MSSQKPATYGYARVSTSDQNLSRQLDALLAFGVDAKHIFSDKASGKDFDRPQYLKLMKAMRAGDVLVIKSIDRLGRNYEEILEQWRLITKEKRVHVVVLDMPLLDTRERPDSITGTFIADLVLQLLSYVAQVERESIRRRQAEGIAAAKARGVQFGRPQKARPRGYKRVLDACATGELRHGDAAACLGVSRTTLYKWMKEDCA